jgi:hypothetical protein
MKMKLSCRISLGLWRELQAVFALSLGKMVIQCAYLLLGTA